MPVRGRESASVSWYSRNSVPTSAATSGATLSQRTRFSIGFTRNPTDAVTYLGIPTPHAPLSPPGRPRSHRRSGSRVFYERTDITRRQMIAGARSTSCSATGKRRPVSTAGSDLQEAPLRAAASDARYRMNAEQGSPRGLEAPSPPLRGRHPSQRGTWPSRSILGPCSPSSRNASSSETKTASGP
jgi:hypothetical protein